MCVRRFSGPLVIPSRGRSSTMHPVCSRWAGMPPATTPAMQCGVLWMLHVPKTGGTTLGRFMQQCAADRGFPAVDFRHSDARFFHGSTQKPWANLSAHVLAYPRPLAAVVHHMGIPGLEPALYREVLLPLRAMLEAKNCTLRLVTMLRSPGERVISSLFYNATFKNGSSLMTPSRMAAALNHKGTNNLNNFQARFVVRGYPIHDSKWHAEKMADDTGLAHEALAVLGRFDAVGRTEELQETIEYVARSLSCPHLPSAAPNRRALAGCTSTYNATCNKSVKPFEPSTEQLRLAEQMAGGEDNALYRSFCS